MSPVPGERPRPASRGHPLVDVATEVIIAAIIWLGMNDLVPLQLGIGSGLLGFTLWAAALAGARALRTIPPGRPWLARGVEWLGPAAGWGVLNRFLAHPLPIRQLLYAIVAVGAAVRLWRAWAARNRSQGGDLPAEPARVLLLVLAVLVALRPYLSDRYVGGKDVRWYAYVLQDFLDQMRAGHFPVFIGQGPYAWSGAVHPFRSAPVYLNLAGLWDVLTFRVLNVYALQHLAALSSAIVGALGFYAAGVALAPRRRWEMLLLALLYACAPAWLSLLYHSDAYMSFMAVAALPLVLYGNARSLLANDGRGHGATAAGLVLVWMCHPPIAMLATLATLLLQGGGLLLGHPPSGAWRGVLAAAVLFAGMGAYYFAGMSELPALVPGSPVPAVLQFAGLALVLAGLVNAILLRRGRLWSILALPGGCLLWLSCIPWFWWLVATVCLVVVIAASARAFGLDPSRHAADILLPCLLAGGGLAQAWLGPDRPERNALSLLGWETNVAQMARLFPLAPGRILAPGVDVEAGVGTWLVLAFLAVAAFRSRALALKLFCFVGVLFVLALTRVPWVSDFFVAYFPDYPARIITFPLLLRMLPVMASFVLFGGVIWMATAGEEGRGGWVAWWVVLGLGASSCGLQAARFAGLGTRFTSSPELTRRPFYQENYVLDRFAYDLLPMPSYFFNGQTDPRLEFRLLDDQQGAYTGPDIIAQRMEAPGSRGLRLMALQDPTARRWLNLTPGLALAPGEQVLLRFEFDPAREYAGVLVFRSEHGYREYQLPNDGMDWGFGTGPGRSRVISLVNSQPTTEHYRLFVAPVDGGDRLGLEGFFGTMIVSRYDPDRNPVRLASWDPLRVTVTADRPGWLETPRSFLPGYVATVDGRPAPIAPSVQHLVKVPLTPGRHVVVLWYRGTVRVWLAAVVSLMTWTGWLGCSWRRRSRS